MKNSNAVTAGKGDSDMRIHTYKVVARFGAEICKATKNDRSEVIKLVEAVLDLGGSIVEIIEEG